MKKLVVDAVEAGSEQWRSYFNTGDAVGCASCYEAEALMIAKPFGEFRGRDEIQKFWEMIIADGFAEVDYRNTEIDVMDERSAVLSAEWEMNKAAGKITKELWVIQGDGRALLREDHFEATS